jgi:hypothetical protein
MIAKPHENIPEPAATDAEAERWWWDEVGVLVEHEVWHLPDLAEERKSVEVI